MSSGLQEPLMGAERSHQYQTAEKTTVSACLQLNCGARIRRTFEANDPFAENQRKPIGSLQCRRDAFWTVFLTVSILTYAIYVLIAL